jgi:enoyl-CoA hydratase/carnithine racemase
VSEFVQVEVSGGVAEIRLERPPVNALNRQVAEELGDHVAAIRDDPGVRAAVVWGGKVFAAGADVKEMAGLDPAAVQRHIAPFQESLSALERLPVVTVAAINGYALGGGCELALACDFRVCGHRARFGQPEILLGIIPGAGGTQRLPRLVGIGRAKEIVYSGRALSAQEAHAIGLVHEVVEPDDVHARAHSIAAGYASGPTVALAAAKHALQTGIETDISSGLLLEQGAFASLFATEDQKIGMESFIEQGPGKAEFTGK